MGKKNKKMKVIALSALVASTTAAVYANKDTIKKNEEADVDTAKLVVHRATDNDGRVIKDKVKISVENINNASKAFQLSLKIEGNVSFKDGDSNIKWLTKVGTNNNTKVESLIENDYILSDNNKTIDIFVASNSELSRNGSTIDICEINLEKSSLKSNSDYKIIPNINNDKIAFKSIDVNNKSLEFEEMNFDDTVLKFNIPPSIILKKSLDNTTEDTNNNADNKNSEITYPSINTIEKTITVKEGYEFNAKSFVDISDEEDKDLNDSNIVVKIREKVDNEYVETEITGMKKDFKVGRHKLVYTVTDKNGESTSLDVDLVVEPDVWSTNPILTGVPDEKIVLYTGDVFNPYAPNKTSVSAKDAKDNVLDVKLSGNFDLEKAGIYTLNYSAKDRFDNSVSKDLILEVIQNDMPKISGIDNVVINKKQEFNKLEGVSVSDDNESVSVDNIKVSGNVDTNIAKKYLLSYEVADNRKPDLKTIKQREVTVNGEPTIYGDLSYIIVKNKESISKDKILNGVIVEDDLDESINLDVANIGDINTSVDGIYKAKITATDTRGLSTESYRDIIVTSKKIVELPESLDGSSEEKSKKMKVLDDQIIKNINDKLSSMTKDYEVYLSKESVLDDILYKIKISPNKIAFKSNLNDTYLEVTVPKEIDIKTGGIVITQHEGIKVSSISVTGNDSELKVGETKVLNATINPSDAENKNLLWSSTNNDIVSIVPSSDTQNATIKALKKGTSTIRVMATDGSETYQELVVKVGEQPKEDTQAPIFDYNGNQDINLANGMKFDIPYVTASDNVDTNIKVTTTILDSNGLNIENIDTTVSGKYTITYTARDKSGNKAELVININVKEKISGIEVGNGNATNQNDALEINSKVNADALNNLLKEIENDKYEAKVYGDKVINKDKNESTYIIKLYKKQGLISKLFNLNKNNEVYYLKITVKNAEEFTSILDKLPKEKPSTGGGSTGGGGSITPTKPETTVTKLIGEDRYETATKISKEGWSKADTVIIVNGNDKQLVDGLTATPLASAKNAPILLSNNKELPKHTIDEIKRLNPSNVIVIGGESSMPSVIINEVKKIKSSINVQRIGGQTRFETSLNIAKEIDKANNITKIYVGAGYGEADSLSISSVAGKDKSPIILTEKDGLNKDTYEYIKSQNVVDGYVIGGELRISEKALKQIDSVVSKDISGNRIAGVERQDTNAKVIEKFYSNTQLDGVVVAKDYDLVDALAVGPLAAKKDIPVLLATKELSKSQENVLGKKKSEKIYETGGGIKSSVVEKLKDLINNRK